MSSHPLVSIIPPSSSLPRNHHGPFSSSSKAKSKQKVKSPIEEDDDGDDECHNSLKHKPKYFKNPWPSYRSASLHDAYLAYQLGAAIAPPPPSQPHTCRSSSSNPVNEYDDQCYSGGEDTAEEEYDSLVSSSRDITGRNGRNKASDVSSIISKTSKVYIRPDFSSIKDDDEIEDEWRDPPVKVVKPDWIDSQRVENDNEAEAGGGKEKITWLGHAGVLLEIPWKDRSGYAGIIFDPIFSYRCSPTQYVGPARYLDSPCSVSELPEIHICCISHDHYDHLDYYTIKDLWKYHQSTIHFLVPLGLKQWFTSSGIPSSRITELDWWHETLISFPSESYEPYSDHEQRYPPSTGESDVRLSSETVNEPSSLRLKIAFTPAQHRSGRGLLDHMTTLWGSWCLGVIESEEDKEKISQRGMKDCVGFKAFFGGDTGYRYATAPEGDDDAVCPAFEEIASHYSPFSLSLLPLSTGSSLPFLRTILSLSLDQYTLTSSLHCSPLDSLEIHKILKSKRSFGIHWGTFCDQDESRGTRIDFGRSRRKLNISKDWFDPDGNCFVIGDIGQTLEIPEDN
ncbi:uncharacterized protein L201_004311 [Kwoniella dendrophila CBS 6074]|uniref:Metallo-beta-lactamase domain-containing protein n=1 Tax=Kwoniella dendrophila CBS 6074 TaxID=1295534 RepID=A0AAX4JWV5_9TREE